MIRTLLVANRGEIACRVIRTAREMGIRTVAVFAPADRAAPHVRIADDAWLLDGTTATGTYLDVQALLRIAADAGADAIHPGYGFLSERADAATAFVHAGLTWVGPRAETIATMGNKIEAKAVMGEARLPILPSEPLDIRCDVSMLEAGDRVGYPLLVKAVAGGGGRGMRRVDDRSALGSAAHAASREADAAFGHAGVFAERFLQSPRHVEVQIFGDQHGGVVHLGARDCSVQRRHQKLIEESPPPGLDDQLLAQMTAAAVAGARRLGYVSAGTFEFLVQDGEFFFLEMNTRLQVEHPVTEETFGVDLVRWQLEVAAGEPLPIEQEHLVSRGHAIEARVCAEDPHKGWLPSTGTIETWRPGPTPVRRDLGIEQGSSVSAIFDSMIGKLIAHAPTRAEAAARLSRALDELVVHGIRTNARFLARVLRHPDFGAGVLSIDFLDQRPELFASPAPEEFHAVIAALHGAACRRSHAAVLEFAPAGWRNVRSHTQEQAFDVEGTRLAISYRLDGARFEASAGETTFVGRAEFPDEHTVVLELGSRRVRATITRSEGTLWVDVLGASSHLVPIPRHPNHEGASNAGHLVAPVPGTVVAVYVRPGDTVEAGARLVVIEAMKMEHIIVAVTAGSVTDVLVRVGDAVEAHAAVALVKSEEAVTTSDSV